MKNIVRLATFAIAAVCPALSFSTPPVAFPKSVTAVEIQQRRTRHGVTDRLTPLAVSLEQGPSKRSPRDDDDDIDDRDFVRVPVRRGERGSRAYYDDQDDYDYDNVRDAGGRYNDEVQDHLYDDDEYDYDEEEWEDGDDDDDDEIDADMDRLLENVIVPNSLLDSIDPDGAADRFPELASDPRFWFDMVLFIAFLNFLSFAGPRDPFPDLPWY